MVQKLTRSDLYSLEQYAEQRDEFRHIVMAHKKNRQLPMGENATLYFEDRLTIQYQIQEILRTEKIFTATEIEEELQAYNPLIPDGSNLKATFMLEYVDPAIRQRALARLIAIEHKIWLQVEGFAKIHAIANEDLERSTDEKTSAVHFLRFEFTDDMKAALFTNRPLSAGIDHDNYRVVIEQVPSNIQTSLLDDFT